MNDTLELTIENDLVEVHVTGKLTREFYEAFAPAVNERIAEFGKVRILLVMHDFHGWTAGALWEDLKFDLRHWRDIRRLAVVGESKWQQGMAAFCKPFTTAKIEYFDRSRLDEARAWIKQD